MEENINSEKTETEQTKTEKIQKILKQTEEDPVMFAKAFNASPKTLSSKQTEFLTQILTRTHIVLTWARQTGKSTVLAIAIAYWLLMGNKERIYVFAPVEDQSKEIYDKVSQILFKHDFFEKYIKKCSSEEIRMYNGNFVKFMSASPGSHVRGKTATRVIIDETEDVTDEKYAGDIIPFLSATQYNKDGSVHAKSLIEAGTPKSKNHFYVTLTKQNVKVIKQLWYENEFSDRGFILDQKAKLPQALFAQEYLCKFIEEGSTCFPTKWFFKEKIIEDKIINGGENRKSAGLSNIDILEEHPCFNKKEDMLPFIERIVTQRKNGATYVVGFDNGRQVDNAALCVWKIDKFPCRIVYNRSFALGTTMPTIVEEIKFLNKIYEPYEINIDWTNEKGFKDYLLENDIPAPEKKPYGLIVFTTQTKIEMITNAQALIQKGLMRLPEKEEILFQQFTQQQYEIVNGKYKYYHPTNSHDDQLWASLLALKNVSFEADDVKDQATINIWEDHNKIVGYEETRYKDFAKNSSKQFGRKKLGKLNSRKRKTKNEMNMISFTDKTLPL